MHVSCHYYYKGGRAGGGAGRERECHFKIMCSPMSVRSKKSKTDNFLRAAMQQRLISLEFKYP